MKIRKVDYIIGSPHSFPGAIFESSTGSMGRITEEAYSDIKYMIKNGYIDGKNINFILNVDRHGDFDVNVVITYRKRKKT